MRKKILMLCLCSIAISAIAQDAITRSETVERAFSIGERDRLEIENKYGNIILEDSESDELKIRVEITFSGGSDKAISELKDFVNVEISKNGSFIIARTNWGKNASFFTKSLEGIKGIFDGDRSVEVNYFVDCPPSLDVRISNKFGDIFIGKHSGRMDISLSHGDLRSRRIEFPEEVSVSYGKMLVDEWGRGRVEILFGEMESKKADRLLITSKQSEIDIDQANELNFNSRNDQIHLKKVGTLLGEYRFSGVKVNELDSALRIDQEHGDIRIESIDESFEQLELTMKRSDATLLVDEFTAFNFSVYLKNGETFSSVPELITLKRDEQIGEERQMEGFWKSAHPTRKLIVRGESAVVNVAKR